MKLAILYAGQGSQHPGMGKDLYEAYPAFRAAFDAAALDFDLHSVCFEDPDGVLNQTEYTQPCMVAFAAGVTAVLQENGVKADDLAGLSLGEYSALQAAGVFTAKQAVELAAYRGKAMADAAKGIDCGMTAVMNLDRDALAKCCEEASALGVVQICNYNCPGQLVISGAVEAVDAACEKAKAAGARRALRLPVGGAFHSPLMEPAKQELEKAINEAPFQAPVCPVYQNVDAKPYTDPAQIKANLIAQLTAPVRWTYIVKNMLADGVTEFTELGPGTVLQGLIKKVNPEATVESKSTL